MAFQPIMVAYFIIDAFFRGKPADFGLIIIFTVLLLIFCGVVLKMADIIKTTITLDDQGIIYHSILKKMVVPWQDIVEIKYVDLTSMGQTPAPQSLLDFKIKTRNFGGIYVFHYIEVAGQVDAISQFIYEVISNTQLKPSGLIPP